MIENLTQINSGITINIVVTAKLWKNILCTKNYVWNPATCTCKNGEYLRSIIDDSLVTCGIEVTKAVTTKITSTKTVRTKSTLTSCYILLIFLLTTISSLIAVSI